MTIEELTFTAFLAGRERGREESAAQIERLREAIEDHIDYADWQYQDQINRGYTNVNKLRAALQPKEGDQ